MNKHSAGSVQDIRMSTIKLKRMQTVGSEMVNLALVDGEDDIDL